MGLTEDRTVLKVRSNKVAVSNSKNVIISFSVAFKKENMFSPFFPQCIIWPLYKQTPITFAPCLL